MVEEDPVEVIEEDPQYYPLSDDDDSPDRELEELCLHQTCL